MKKDRVYENWFAQACSDLEDAKYLMKGRKYNSACFFAQQAVEKALKAFLLFAGADQVWGHSVYELCNDSRDFDEDFAQICEEVALLDKYYIPTRYPDALPGGIPSLVYGFQDASAAISIAEKALKFIGGKIGMKCPGGGEVNEQ